MMSATGTSLLFSLAESLIYSFVCLYVYKSVFYICIICHHLPLRFYIHVQNNFQRMRQYIKFSMLKKWFKAHRLSLSRNLVSQHIQIVM